MVQLKGCNGFLYNTPPLKFQFQYGTIKRATNTTTITIVLGFNSNMVQLKDPLGALCKCAFRGFNSNMVQLKDVAISVIVLIVIVFQFQYGTIKS